MSEIGIGQEKLAGGLDSQDEIDLLTLLGALLDQKWTVIIATGSCIVLALSYVVVATPVYQASALLQVEEKAASLPGLEDLSEAFGSESSTQAELEILKSRSVIGSAITKLNLTTVAEPKFFPVIGDFVHRRFEASSEMPFASAPWGLGSYARGGEAISVTRFEPTAALLDETFVLTATGGNQFKLEQKDFGISLEGKIGTLLNSGGIVLFVSSLDARTGTQFEITKDSWLKTVQNVRSALSVGEVGRHRALSASLIKTLMPIPLKSW